MELELEGLFYWLILSCIFARAWKNDVYFFKNANLLEDLHWAAIRLKPLAR